MNQDADKVVEKVEKLVDYAWKTGRRYQLMERFVYNRLIIKQKPPNTGRKDDSMKKYRTEIVKNTEIPGDWYILRVYDNKDNKIVMSTTDSLAECKWEAKYWQDKKR